MAILSSIIQTPTALLKGFSWQLPHQILFFVFSLLIVVRHKIYIFFNFACAGGLA